MQPNEDADRRSARTDPAPWAVETVRQDFPALHQEVRGVPLTYLDNAATSQKPRAVIATIEHYYRADNANVHRAVHELSARATAAYEGARSKVARFINARSADEIVFLRGTTEAINLVANGLALGEGDEVVLTQMEHHANIVPWQLQRTRSGVVLRVLPITPRGELELEQLEGMLNERTRLLAVTHVSNVLGTVNPIAAIVQAAHRHGVPVLVDGAQAVPHLEVDVQAIDCDYYCFSGHKLFGPTGIGVLFGKSERLAALPPYQGGGEMIRRVSFEETVYADPPQRFEAGTPNIAGAVGLGAAIEYLNGLDHEAIRAHERDLLEYATARLREVPGLRIIGESQHKIAVISLVMEDVHAHDLGTVLDDKGVAVRAGHHCAMPLMTFFSVPATARASFAFYNTHQEVDRLIDGLRLAREMLT
jgi:cysteine desulfurase/selenocysteine lyase